jgi:hypothetical protein
MRGRRIVNREAISDRSPAILPGAEGIEAKIRNFHGVENFFHGVEVPDFFA